LSSWLSLSSRLRLTLDVVQDHDFVVVLLACLQHSSHLLAHPFVVLSCSGVARATAGHWVVGLDAKSEVAREVVLPVEPEGSNVEAHCLVDVFTTERTFVAPRQFLIAVRAQAVAACHKDSLLLCRSNAQGTHDCDEIVDTEVLQKCLQFGFTHWRFRLWRSRCWGLGLGKPVLDDPGPFLTSGLVRCVAFGLALAVVS